MFGVRAVRADKGWGLKKLLFVENIRERKIANVKRKGQETSAVVV
jgi:hypothetical protein